jgi:hypothetical protein
VSLIHCALRSLPKCRSKLAHHFCELICEMTYAPSGYTGRIGKPHAAEPMEAEPLNQEPWRATYSKGSSGNSKTGPYDGINPGKMAKPKPWADGASQIDKVSPESVYGGDASYYSAWNPPVWNPPPLTIPSPPPILLPPQRYLGQTP